MIKKFCLVALTLVLLGTGHSGKIGFGAETAVQNGAGWASGQSNGGLQPVLTVSPREVDLGSIGPGEEVTGVFYMRSVGAGNLEWSTDGPEGWTATDYQVISGTVGSNPEPIKISLLFLDESRLGKSSACTLLFRIEGGGQYAVFRREIPLGIFRDAIRLNSPSGTKTVFYQVRLSPLAAAALLDIEPVRLDFGTIRPGEQITKRVQVTNKGKERLKWRALHSGRRGKAARSTNPPGRYISFRNEAISGTGSYSAPAPLRESVDLSGHWMEESGYPVAQDDQCSFRYRFQGTGISVFLLKTPEGGPLGVFLDEQLVDIIDGFSDRRELVEIPIIDNQPEASHLLAVVNRGGRVIVEGVRTFGKPVLKGAPGWLTVFPDSGMTTRETDYVNIQLNARQLVPGLYGEPVVFESNGGETEVEVFLEVAAETQPRFLDVYLYVYGLDYLYTAKPQNEASRLRAKGYQNLGIAFRLFNPGTPGTTDFFRWFNPTKGDHYYSSDPSGGGKLLSGYIFEGSIGNIATSRLTGTRELYRWYNPKTGYHFYSTNQKGEGIEKKGYRFDGIAGFVR